MPKIDDDDDDGDHDDDDDDDVDDDHDYDVFSSSQRIWIAVATRGMRGGAINYDDDDDDNGDDDDDDDDVGRRGLLNPCFEEAFLLNIGHI